MRPRKHPGLRYYPCRCTKCGTRRTLRQHPDSYYHRHHAKCRACGADALRVDRYRGSGKEAKRTLCYCDHYPFPHRRGSLLCMHGVMGAEGFSYYSRDEAEHIQREQLLFQQFQALQRVQLERAA